MSPEPRPIHVNDLWIIRRSLAHIVAWLESADRSIVSPLAGRVGSFVENHQHRIDGDYAREASAAVLNGSWDDGDRVLRRARRSRREAETMKGLAGKLREQRPLKTAVKDLEGVMTAVDVLIESEKSR